MRHERCMTHMVHHAGRALIHDNHQPVDMEREMFELVVGCLPTVRQRGDFLTRLPFRQCLFLDEFENGSGDPAKETRLFRTGAASFSFNFNDVKTASARP